jgi:hypothetical protein
METGLSETARRSKVSRVILSAVLAGTASES